MSTYVTTRIHRYKRHAYRSYLWYLPERRRVDCVWNVMAHMQKPDSVFRRNGPVHLNRRGLQFSRLLAAEVCASAVVMLETPCSEVLWRVLATHLLRQFPLHLRHRVPSHFIWTLIHSQFTTLEGADRLITHQIKHTLFAFFMRIKVCKIILSYFLGLHIFVYIWYIQS